MGGLQIACFVHPEMGHCASARLVKGLFMVLIIVGSREEVKGERTKKPPQNTDIFISIKI